MGLHIGMSLIASGIFFRDEFLLHCDDSSAPPLEVDFDDNLEIDDIDLETSVAIEESTNSFLVQRKLEDKRDYHRRLLTELEVELNLMLEQESTIKEQKAF